jgi:hypothetical protein
MARSAAAKAVSVIFNDSGGVEIGLSGDGEEALNRHSSDGWLTQPPSC